MKKNIFKNDILISKILKLPICAKLFIYDILSLSIGFTLYLVPIFNEIFILEIIGLVLMIIGLFLLMFIPEFISYLFGKCNRCNKYKYMNYNDVDIDD